MNRREFVGYVSGALTWPLMTRAQPAAAQRVGYLSDESRSLQMESFGSLAEALRKLGYVDGSNIVFESRSSDGKSDALPGLAAELIRKGVDVIVTVGTPATRAAKRATDTIPIVFFRVADPVALGLVRQLARPEGNLTGVTVITQDLAAKRLELLAAVTPEVKHVGVLWDPMFPSASLELKEIEGAARVLNIELHQVGVRDIEDLEAALDAVTRKDGRALFVVPAILFTEQRQRIAESAIKRRLPTMLSRREHVEAGGLISYGVNYSDMYRRTATYVDKILKGAKPSELPIEQPTMFELVINLKTAKALGLTIPQSILLRATEVIE